MTKSDALMTSLAAEAFSTGYWGAVGLAAAIATALATAASTATAIWWRYQDRAEAEFSLRVEARGKVDNSGNRIAAPQVEVVVQNIGDGAAHQVRVTGVSLQSNPSVREPQLVKGSGMSVHRPKIHQPIPVLRTGDSIFVRINVDSIDVWPQASLEINWWPPPTRKKTDWWVRSRQRRQAFPLGAVGPPPKT